MSDEVNIEYMMLLRSELRRIDSRIKQLSSFEEELKTLRNRRSEILADFKKHAFDDIKSFKNLSLTNAILLILNESSESLTAYEVYDSLRGTDFISGAKDFYISIHSLCKKLARRKKIRETTKQGKIAFRKK